MQGMQRADPSGDAVLQEASDPALLRLYAEGEAGADRGGWLSCEGYQG